MITTMVYFSRTNVITINNNENNHWEHVHMYVHVLMRRYWHADLDFPRLYWPNCVLLIPYSIRCNGSERRVSRYLSPFSHKWIRENYRSFIYVFIYEAFVYRCSCSHSNGYIQLLHVRGTSPVCSWATGKSVHRKWKVNEKKNSNLRWMRETYGKFE